MSKNVVTLKSGSEVTQGHRTCYHSIERVWLVSYYCSLVTLSLKRTVLRYSTCKYTVTLKPGLGSLKVVENYTIQSGTHDFLLTSHNNHRPISHRFRDKRRYLSKISQKLPIFPPQCIYRPSEEVPLEFCITARSQETRMMGLSDGRKSFQIGLAVLIQYRRVTNTQPARCRSKNAAYYVARVTRSSADADN